MWIVLKSGLGDEVAVTGLVREVKREFPNEVIHVDIGRADLLEGNPYIGYGREQKRPTVVLTPLHPENERAGNLIVSYARQCGVGVVDSTPEIFLRDSEIEHGKKLLALTSTPKAMKPRAVIAFDTWATWPSRRWPLERFQSLVGMLRELGFFTVELGKNVNDERGDFPSLRLPVDRDLFGNLSVRETAAVLASCDLFVGNDSGLMHLAAAVGTPQVAFFSVKSWYSRAYWNTTPLFSPSPCRTDCLLFCGRSPEDHCLNELTFKDAMLAIGLALKRFPKQEGSLEAFLEIGR